MNVSSVVPLTRRARLLDSDPADFGCQGIFMQNVKMLSDVVDVARRAADRWYVSTGHAAVGPVKLDLLARGVEAGKVPLEAFVRHEEWTVWRPLSELAVISGDGEVADEPTDDISEVGRPSVPADFSPTDALDGAADRREALALLMTAAVVRGGADAVMVHEIEEDTVVVVCAHGPCRSEVLGVRTPRLDPALAAVASGETFVVEPDVEPGPAARSILGRLCRLAGPIDGALLLPIRVHDQLCGLLEIGRRTAFTAGEVASLEALVAALAHKLEGWSA
jgi:hypothetical protein